MREAKEILQYLQCATGEAGTQAETLAHGLRRLPRGTKEAPNGQRRDKEPRKDRARITRRTCDERFSTHLQKRTSSARPVMW